MSYFVIIRGPAASGKTTISKPLAEKLNAHYISFDMIRERCGIGLSEDDRIAANNKAIPEARKILESGKVVIFDGVFYHKSQIKHLIKELPFKHFIFTIKASLDTCMKRHVERESYMEGKSDISGKSVREVYELVTKFDYGTVINTEGKSVEETVDEIISHIR